MSRDEFSPHAESIPFDNDTNGFTADDVQAAIEEAADQVNQSASPGFSFGRSGNIPSGSWLLCESVPCNKAGRRVYINNASIQKIFTNTENLDTYNIAVYSHDGDEVNLSLLGTYTVTASRGATFDVNLSVTTGKQLALRITSGSATNIVAGLELRGTSS